MLEINDILLHCIELMSTTPILVTALPKIVYKWLFHHDLYLSVFLHFQWEEVTKRLTFQHDWIQQQFTYIETWLPFRVLKFAWGKLSEASRSFLQAEVPNLWPNPPRSCDRIAVIIALMSMTPLFLTMLFYKYLSTTTCIYLFCHTSGGTRPAPPPSVPQAVQSETR